MMVEVLLMVGAAVVMALTWAEIAPQLFHVTDETLGFGVRVGGGLVLAIAVFLFFWTLWFGL